MPVFSPPAVIRYIEIDLGDGDFSIINWDKTFSIEVRKIAATQERPGYIIGIIAACPEHVRIDVTTVDECEDIVLQSDADISVIQSSIIEQIQRLNYG